jgi:hypothetical protein
MAGLGWHVARLGSVLCSGEQRPAQTIERAATIQWRETGADCALPALERPHSNIVVIGVQHTAAILSPEMAPPKLVREP